MPTKYGLNYASVIKSNPGKTKKERKTRRDALVTFRKAAKGIVEDNKKKY